MSSFSKTKAYKDKASVYQIKSYFCTVFTKALKKKLTECAIPLSSLKNGEHTFTFDINESLFTENQYNDIHKAELKAEISFNKNSTILTFNFTINGTANVTCDRCGDDFNMQVVVKRQLIVKTQSAEHQEEDDMVCLAGNETEFDAAPFIYQYVVLALPMQKIHPTDKNGKSECNPEAIDKLKHIHVEKSNDEKYVLNSNMHFATKEESFKQ